MTTRAAREVKRPTQPKKTNRAKASARVGSRHLTSLSDRQATTGRAILIHGETGVGKTVLSILKAPRPVLVLDCDNGIDSVIGAPGDIDVWGPSEGYNLTWADMDEFREYVVAGEWDKDYATIVCDNITAGQKPVIRSILLERGERMSADDEPLDLESVSQQDWGRVYRRLDQWIRDVRDAKRRGTHVVFTAGSHSWMDEAAGYEKITPDLEGRERKQISTHMDAVGYLEFDEDDDSRVLSLAPSGAIITKVRVPVSLHGKVPEELRNPDFERLIEAVGVIAKKGGSTKKGSSRRKPTTKKET